MKISVITVCYNSAATLENTINSVLDQSHRDIEYIVIDGGSTDGTTKIIEKFGDRISKIISEPDNGIYDAMNKGLALFTGDAVGFLNSDDCYYDETSLSRIADALGRADLATGDLHFVRAHDGSTPVRVWKAEPYWPKAFQGGWSLPHPTTYARRSVYERVGQFNTNFRSAGDYDWLIRALEIENFRHTTVHTPIVNMLIGGESTAGLRSLIQNSREMLRSRQERLGTGMVDAALFYNLLRKIKQIRRTS